MIKVDKGTFKEVFKYYGHWSIFVGLFFLIWSIRFVDIQYDYTIARWADSANQK